MKSHSCAAGHLYDCGILHNESVHSGRGKVHDKFTGFLQFIFIENGVYRNKYPCSIAVGIVAQVPYVFNGVSCSGAGPESRPGNVHGIGAAVYCGFSDIGRACRSK